MCFASFCNTVSKRLICIPPTLCAVALWNIAGKSLVRPENQTHSQKYIFCLYVVFRMVVILIVPAPTSPDNGAGKYGKVVDPAKSPGDRSTSTTSISFVSSDNSSYYCSQVDPDNLIATTKEGKTDIMIMLFIIIVLFILVNL